MQDVLLPHVIFSPGTLALVLAAQLAELGHSVALFSPGQVTCAPNVQNITADMSLFRHELAGRGYGYIELLKKHPLTFVAMARQVQAELISQAFATANRDELDVVHIYTNEEDIALPFAQFCIKPVVFTHHDPFSFLVKYKNTFPKYKHLNWISISIAQRAEMPPDTNWVGNIHHGLPVDEYVPNYTPAATQPYVVCLGRIIEAKGVHLAIAAVKEYNQVARSARKPTLRLKIAGQHYAGHAKDTYWHDKILPYIDGTEIEYVGFAKKTAEKQKLLGGATALLMPSTFNEPFGMVAIESMACATPVVGLGSGAIAEVVGQYGGVIVPYSTTTTAGRVIPDNHAIIDGLVMALQKVRAVDRRRCRSQFENNFSAMRMAKEHLATYIKLIGPIAD